MIITEPRDCRECEHWVPGPQKVLKRPAFLGDRTDLGPGMQAHVVGGTCKRETALRYRNEVCCTCGCDNWTPMTSAHQKAERVAFLATG